MKLDTGRRSAFFERDEEIVLKGVFAKLKISDELSATLSLLLYLGITYKKNEVVKEILEWFEYGVDFLRLCSRIKFIGRIQWNKETVLFDVVYR